MSENIITVKDNNLDKIMEDLELPLLVDFWAQWCGPCRSFEKIFIEVATLEEYQDKIKFAKADVDENQEVAAKYNIKGVPTIIIFKNREVLSKQVGSMTKSQLQLFINENIN